MGESKSVSAMSFYDSDGLTSSWNKAICFAGDGGRLATLPDIILARINADDEDIPWTQWFTTTSVEYFGLSKAGIPIIIVAHGIGPLTTLDRINMAYDHDIGQNGRSRNGGIVDRKDFLNLESGKYGDVAIVDYESYVKRFKYPFIEATSTDDAIDDPLIWARFGNFTSTYLTKHLGISWAYHQENGRTDVKNPLLLEIKDNINMPYGCIEYRTSFPFEDKAYAHLLSTGQLTQTRFWGMNYPELSIDISCHQRGNGVRFVGIKAGSELKTIAAGPDARKILYQNRDKLMVPAINASFDLVCLLEIGNDWYSEYPKSGSSMDSREPEFLLTKREAVGSPVEFKTKIGGYYGFFRYDIQEMKKLGKTISEQINAYEIVDEPTIITVDGNPEFHHCQVQFYHCELDLSQRLMRSSELNKNFPLMMELMNSK